MTQHLTTIFGVAGPAAVALAAWLTNEWSKRRADRYQRKEQRYAVHVEALQGFYSTTGPTQAAQLKQSFIVELNKWWLHCPAHDVKVTCELASHSTRLLAFGSGRANSTVRNRFGRPARL